MWAWCWHKQGVCSQEWAKGQDISLADDSFLAYVTLMLHSPSLLRVTLMLPYAASSRLKPPCAPSAALSHTYCCASLLSTPLLTCRGIASPNPLESSKGISRSLLPAVLPPPISQHTLDVLQRIGVFLNSDVTLLTKVQMGE